MMFKEIVALLYKEILLEWKQKYSLNGLMLYAGSMAVVVALSLLGKFEGSGESLLLLKHRTWNVLFWLMMLFVAINSVAKSFLGAQEGQMQYLYGLVSARSVIISKSIYNCGLLFAIGLPTLAIHAFLGEAVIQHLGGYVYILFVGSFCFASVLTLVSAIASKAHNSGVLLAVLGFPLIIPVMLLLIKGSSQAMEGLDFTVVAKNVNLAFAIGIGGLGMSSVLFPFVWRE